MRVTVILLLATVLWGVWGVAEKAAVTRAHPFTVQWVYAIPYALTIPFWFWLSRQSGGNSPTAGAWGWAIAGSLAAQLALLLLLVAMQERPASVAVAVTAAYPLVTLLVGWWSGQESLEPVRVVGIVLIVVGVWLVQATG